MRPSRDVRETIEGNHAVSFFRLTSSQWSNSYRFFFSPGSNSLRRACSSSSVMKPVLTCTWDPSFCTSSRLDPTISASSGAENGLVLTQRWRLCPTAGLWTPLIIVSNSFILLPQMLTVISNTQYFFTISFESGVKVECWAPF